MLGENLALTTYIGFEYPGTEMAEKFTALTKEQKNEVRVMCGEMILQYWEDVGSPLAPEDGDEADATGIIDEDDAEPVSSTSEGGMNLAQCDCDAGCDAEAGTEASTQWGYGYAGGYGGYGYGGYGGFGGCGCCCRTYCRVVPGCCTRQHTHVIHRHFNDVHHHHNHICRHNLHIRKFRVPGYRTFRHCGC